MKPLGDGTVLVDDRWADITQTPAAKRRGTQDGFIIHFQDIAELRVMVFIRSEKNYVKDNYGLFASNVSGKHEVVQGQVWNYDPIPAEAIRDQDGLAIAPRLVITDDDVSSHRVNRQWVRGDTLVCVITIHPDHRFPRAGDALSRFSFRRPGGAG